MTNTKQERYWRMRIFGLTWLAYAGFYFCRKNFSVAMPILTKDLGTTKEEFAIAITAYSLMYMLGQFLNGYMSDRKGPRLIVSIGMILSVLANFLMGWAGTIASFAFLMGLNGLGQSAGWSGTVKNMTPWFYHKERGRVMSFWTTNYVIGGIAATAFATYWATHQTLFVNLEWKRAFWAPAFVLIIILTIYSVFTRNNPSDAGLRIITDNTSDKEKEQLSANAKKEAQKKVISTPAVWAAAGIYFFVKFTRYAFLFWLPLYLSEALHYSNQLAGYSSIAYEAVGFIGVIAAGFISDKLFSARRFPISAIMLLGLSVTLALQPVLSHLGWTPTMIVIGLIGFFTYGPDSILSGATAMDIGEENGAALAAGIINGVGSLGQLLSPLVVAFVSDKYGWDNLFKVFMVFALAASVISLTQWQSDTKTQETNEEEIPENSLSYEK